MACLQHLALWGYICISTTKDVRNTYLVFAKRYITDISRFGETVSCSSGGVWQKEWNTLSIIMIKRLQLYYFPEMKIHKSEKKACDVFFWLFTLSLLVSLSYLHYHTQHTHLVVCTHVHTHYTQMYTQSTATPAMIQRAGSLEQRCGYHNTYRVFMETKPKYSLCIRSSNLQPCIYWNTMLGKFQRWNNSPWKYWERENIFYKYKNIIKILYRYKDKNIVLEMNLFWY